MKTAASGKVSVRGVGYSGQGYGVQYVCTLLNITDYPLPHSLRLTALIRFYRQSTSSTDYYLHCSTTCLWKVELSALVFRIWNTFAQMLVFTFVVFSKCK